VEEKATAARRRATVKQFMMSLVYFQGGGCKVIKNKSISFVIKIW
jgi:hypothetical protein